MKKCIGKSCIWITDLQDGRYVFTSGNDGKHGGGSTNEFMDKEKIIMLRDMLNDLFPANEYTSGSDHF